MDDKINYKILYLKYKNKYKKLKGGNNILFNKYSKKLILQILITMIVII